MAPKSTLDIFGGAHVGQADGITIWRIENMAPVEQPKDTYGKFFAGDSYIVLNRFEVKGSVKMNLHFWLGDESSQDEKGAAAILTAELDQALGDLPVQFRELQGHESPEFLQLFPNGVQYAAGGIDSGFKKVERDVYETRLLHVKGRRNVRVLQVPPVVGSLNSGDVFILDQGLTIYQWNGAGASKAEKAKGLDISVQIKDEERGGRAKVIPLSEGDTGDAAAAFFAALGHTGSLAAVKIKSEEEGGADDAADALGGPPRLFEVTDPKAGKGRPVEARPLVREMLATGGAYVLLADGAVYCWLGKACPEAAKSGAMGVCAAFAAAHGVPSTAQHKVIKEGTEPPLFKQNFKQWNKPVLPAPLAASATPKKREAAEVDVAALVRASKAASEADDKPLDDGSGELTIWRIENFERADWPRALYGQFYAGDSYVLLYKYKDASKRDAAMIYFWQGRDSSTDEKAAAALQAKALDDAMGGWPVQCRVVQGKEPNHFFALFKGGMIVHSGGKASGFKNVQEEEAAALGSVPALYHVRGTAAANTRAVQVETSAASLNSGDCFVLLAPGSGLFLWQGRFSSDEEKSHAAGVMAALAKEAGVAAGACATVAEGAEPDAFWAGLGGRGEYPQFAEGAVPSQEPRLFQICDAAVGGAGVAVEEVFNFSQDDLCDDDIMMLDTYSALYLWVGRGANENEKAQADAFAARYLAAAAETDGRDADATPVIKVAAGAEPALFTCHFTGWDAKKAAAFTDPYEAKLAALRAAKAEAEAKEAAAAPKAAPAAAASPKAAATPAGSKTFPYDQLRLMRAEDGIAPDAKESYLSDADFATVFGMDKAAFAKLPAWKRTDAKKKAGLF